MQFYLLVEMTGLEPVNPLLAKQVLSQLSYTPMFSYEVSSKTLKIEQRINFFKSFSFFPLSRIHDFIFFVVIYRVHFDIIANFLTLLNFSLNSSLYLNFLSLRFSS